MRIILSSVPEAHSSGPYSEASVTNEYRISVLYGPVPAINNGGSPILSYDLQIDYV